MLVELEPQPRSHGLTRAQGEFSSPQGHEGVELWQVRTSLIVYSPDGFFYTWVSSPTRSAYVGICRVYCLDDAEIACELAMRVFTFGLRTVSPRAFSIDIVRFVRYKYTLGRRLHSSHSVIMLLRAIVRIYGTMRHVRK